jgi:hypothetical protein
MGVLSRYSMQSKLYSTVFGLHGLRELSLAA